MRSGFGAGTRSQRPAIDAGSEMDRARVLVLLPTYNELDNLTALVVGILGQVPSAHILIIDDASPDGTGDLAERLRADRPGVIEVVHRAGKQGLGTAYLRGFRHAIERGYDRIVTMDADLSHAPAHLPAILQAASGADLVVGSRYTPGGRTVNWGLDRRALSIWANVFTRQALGLTVRDCTTGYRCYGRRLLESIDLDQIVADGYSFQIEMLWRSLHIGARVREVPITFVERAHGVSKISRDEIFKAVSTVVGLRRMAAEERAGDRAPAPATFPVRPVPAFPRSRPGGVDLSILIVSYDTADFLEACLESIFRFPPECSFEVVVVDNCSSDGSAAPVRRRFPQVRLRELEENVGFARASNLALREAGGRYLLLLNSDTRVLEESLQGLVRVLDENPRVGVVGCKQLDGQNRLQLTWGRFPSFFNEIVRKALHWRLRINGAQVREYLDRRYHGSSRVDWVAGSCLMARREAVEDGGLLDENIFLYFEDIDWCRRIQLRGWGILYEPGVRIIHYGGESAKRHPIDALVAYRRSQLYFCRKYFGRTALIVLKALVAAKLSLAFVRHSTGWLAAGGNREERFRASGMLLTIKRIAQALFEPIPGPATLPAPLEILEPAAAETREVRPPVMSAGRLRPTRVLHAINTSEEGGGARHLFQLVSRLDPLAFAPVVATTDHGPLVGRLEASNVQVVDVDMMRGRIDPRPVLRLRRVLRRGFDLVHLHGTRAGFFGTLALQGVEPRPRVIYTVHCLSCHRRATAPVRSFFAQIERFVAQRADRVISVSERDRRFGVERGIFPADRTTSIPNGIDLAAFPASMPQPFSRPGSVEIVTIARLVRQKGIRFLVEAARQVIDRHPGARFTVFGDGPERLALEAQAARLGLGERLRFAGIATDVVSDLAFSDLFVLPSLWEGMPISLLEAMAAGRPVIATAVSGSSELVIDGKTGVLVPPADPEALAAAIDTLLRDRAAASAMAVAARDRVHRDFSVDRMVGSTAEIYRELLRS